MKFDIRDPLCAAIYKTIRVAGYTIEVKANGQQLMAPIAFDTNFDINYDPNVLTPGTATEYVLNPYGRIVVDPNNPGILLTRTHTGIIDIRIVKEPVNARVQETVETSDASLPDEAYAPIVFDPLAKPRYDTVADVRKQSSIVFGIDTPAIPLTDAGEEAQAVQQPPLHGPQEARNDNGGGQDRVPEGGHTGKCDAGGGGSQCSEADAGRGQPLAPDAQSGPEAPGTDRTIRSGEVVHGTDDGDGDAPAPYNPHTAYTLPVNFH